MDLSNFAERLSELLFEHNINASQLGEELGCGNATISHYLTERYFPNLEMTIRMANYFNCSTDYLLGITEQSLSQNFKPCPPFGERFRAVCIEFHISRYKLHQLTNIPESVMRYWVNGKTSPSIVNLVKIAEKLNVTIDYLIGRE